MEDRRTQRTCSPELNRAKAYGHQNTHHSVYYVQGASLVDALAAPCLQAAAQEHTRGMQRTLCLLLGCPRTFYTRSPRRRAINGCWTDKPLRVSQLLDHARMPALHSSHIKQPRARRAAQRGSSFLLLPWSQDRLNAPPAARSPVCALTKHPHRTAHNHTDDNPATNKAWTQRHAS